MARDSDFKEFREWAESKQYSRFTIKNWVYNLQSLLELGVDIDSVTADEIREKFWGKNRLKRSLKITAARRYQEFLKEGAFQSGPSG